jgi:hypothetical protein
MDAGALRESTTAELVDVIDQLDALMTATHAQLLQVVAEYDRREAWRSRRRAALRAPPGQGVIDPSGADPARGAGAVAAGLNRLGGPVRHKADLRRGHPD